MTEKRICWISFGWLLQMIHRKPPTVYSSAVSADFGSIEAGACGCAVNELLPKPLPNGIFNGR
jgi:hypothetical protein